MRVCATVNAAGIGLVLVIATFVACAGSSSTPPPAGGKDSPNATETASPSAGSAPGETSAGEPAAAADKPKKDPETVADCKEMLTEITNEPPSAGVVMNNATPDADAGSSRLAPLTDLIKEKRNSFRCCFDIWAKTRPGVNGRVRLTFQLKPDGTLIKAEIDKEESTITVPEVESCMVDVAKAMTFPKSPTGKETKFWYPFDFKARN